MSLAHTLYPFALAGLNLLTGWLVYTHVAPLFGAMLVGTGLLVGLAVVVGLIRDHSPCFHSSV